MSDQNKINAELVVFMKEIKSWLGKQPHLPQNIEDNFLKRFVYSSNKSLEKCKTLIDLNFTLRSQAPEIFDHRDPKSEAMQSIFDAINFCPLPNMTEKRHKLFIYRLNDSDPDKFLYADVMKAFFMVADLRMSLEDENAEGEIPLFDMAGTSLRHLAKMTLPLVKKYMVYTQEAHPVRLRQIHILNTTSFLDKCLALVKPFLKSEVAQVLHFHTPNSTTLFDYVAPELIPEDYGGTLGRSMREIHYEWRQKVWKNRSFYLDDTKWKIDEAKRPYENKSGGRNLFGMQGSFRALTID